jgi:hypothetical protein
MKPTAMAYDRQLLLVMRLRIPAAMVAAIAAAPRMASLHHRAPAPAAPVV